MRRAILVGASLVIAGVIAASCSSSSNGVASESAAQILNSAINAINSATSAHISGSITKSNQPVQLDITDFSNGDIDGTLTVGGAGLGIIKIGPTDYLKATAAFYESQGASASVAAKLGGLWIQFPDTQEGFGSSLSLEALANSFKKNPGKLSKGATSTVNGQSAIAIVSSKGGTLYVATTGPAYPLQITDSSQANGVGTVTLSDWNQGSIPTAPAGARTPESLG
jgi:hypothetical protein